MYPLVNWKPVELNEECSTEVDGFRACGDSMSDELVGDADPNVFFVVVSAGCDQGKNGNLSTD